MSRLRCHVSISLRVHRHPSRARAVPVLLGGGARLFDDLAGANVELEQVRAVEAPGVTHLKYKVRT
jgi:hypothetical protein